MWITNQKDVKFKKMKQIYKKVKQNKTLVYKVLEGNKMQLQTMNEKIIINYEIKQDHRTKTEKG